MTARLLRSCAWALCNVLLGCTRSPSPVPGAGSPAGSNPPSVFVEPEAGERHLRNLRQRTLGVNNAEA